MLDLKLDTEFGARVLQRLQSEPIIWLTTVNASGMPQPSPVWFLWEAGSVLIYSKPNVPKLRNIARNPSVALNFDGNGQGGNIIVLTGTAQIEADAAPAHRVAEYAQKYGAYMARNGWSHEKFAQLYSVAIRVTPQDVRGH